MQNRGMPTIDLVKHQNTILPGLEEAVHNLVGRLNEARKLIHRAPLILIEDQQFLRDREQALRKRLLRQRLGMARIEKKKAEAELVCVHIARREQEARLKARNVKTLVKRRRT